MIGSGPCVGFQTYVLGQGAAPLLVLPLFPQRQPKMTPTGVTDGFGSFKIRTENIAAFIPSCDRGPHAPLPPKLPLSQAVNALIFCDTSSTRVAHLLLLARLTF